ncbi:hypothetical protein BD410DRAFT_782364 [Rickenella mellea]|uniref:Uncharacterized protein n=1 Tax=Rickenella mellea TaxID=50990 RepID=A0A4Y7QI16_9AGAM|nr:hypothetical protein BD410DRAFT_782364 [Rickenella mellea]
MARPDDQLKSFVARAPNARYTFDSERDASESELCREQTGDQRRECIMVQMQSKRLFAAMQEHGFFCALPFDPSRTHMECTPLPKT